MPSPFAAGAADGEVADGDVPAVGGMDRPHQAVFGGESFQPDAVAADGLDQRGMAQRILCGGPAAQGSVAGYLSRSGDADIGGVEGIDQAYPAGNPFALPAHLGNRIIGEIRAAQEDRILFQAQRGVGSQRDGSDEISAGGHHHVAAAQHRAAVDSLLEGRGVFGGAVARRAEIAHIEREFSFGWGPACLRAGGLIQPSRGEALRRHLEETATWHFHGLHLSLDRFSHTASGPSGVE